jgi:hypothetical protein
MKPAMAPVMRIRPWPRARISFPNQINGSRDVGVHDLSDVEEILIQESMPEPATRAREQGGDRTTADRRTKTIDAFGRRKIRLQRGDRKAMGAEFDRDAFNRWLVRCDDEVEARPGAATR